MFLVKHGFSKTMTSLPTPKRDTEMLQKLVHWRAKLREQGTQAAREVLRVFEDEACRLYALPKRRQPDSAVADTDHDGGGGAMAAAPATKRRRV